MSSGKKLNFSAADVDWSKWDKTKDLQEIPKLMTHMHNCQVNHDPDNLDPNCTCVLLANEYDGTEISQPILQGLYASECKDAFKWDKIAGNFCNVDENNFKSALGPPGDSCINRDTDNTMRLKYCKIEDKIKSDGECTKSKLGETKYHEAAKTYCDANPTDRWCNCYNILNNVCKTNMNAYGCSKSYGDLEKKKNDFGLCDANYKHDCIDDDDTTKGVVGYKILNENKHCRPGVCDDGYIPKDSTKGCEESYFMCDNYIDIRSMTDDEIVVKCNYGRDKTPEWMKQPGSSGSTAAERAKRRSPPFNKPPWNKLPITRWPRKFRWADPNVRYITQYSVSSISSCILCISLIMFSRS